MFARRRLPQLLLTAAMLLLASPAAHAANGEYSVRLTSTSGSFWYLHGRGPFLHDATRIYAGRGTFGAGDYRSWRAAVPGVGASIVGGRVRIAMSTPHTAMRARVLVGTANTASTLYDAGVEGAIEQALPPGPSDWVQYDLRSTAAVTTSRPGDDFVNLQWMDLVLRDSVPPVVEGQALPSPATWYDASACVPFTLRLSDQGGGLLRAQVRRASDGAIVSELGTTQQASTQPGPTSQTLQDCIQPHERLHGDTTYIASVWDVGGLMRELTFSVRADHRSPTIAAGPADGTRFTIDRPELAFQVGDDGSGISSVTTSIDGTPVPVTVSGSTARLTVGTLPIGEHVVAISVADVAGNVSRIERHVSVADSAAPVLTVDAPGPRGESTAWLSVRATDDMSGVDATTWVVTVNGEPVSVDGDASHVTATLGPLAPGHQRIEVRVADRAGNVATAAHPYDVASAAVPGMPDIGARTGAFVVEQPRGAVAYGRPTAVSVLVARNGRPIAGQVVEVRREDAVYGSATTDASGVARVPFTAMAPGTWKAWVAGTHLDPADVTLHVSPRIILRANRRRARAGQRITLSGRIAPALRGRRLVVQARVGGVWYPIRRSAVTSVDGSFRTSVTSSSPGRILVRMQVAASGSWGAAWSNQRSLLITRRRAVRHATRPPSRRGRARSSACSKEGPATAVNAAAHATCVTVNAVPSSKAVVTWSSIEEPATA